MNLTLRALLILLPAAISWAIQVAFPDFSRRRPIFFLILAALVVVAYATLITFVYPLL